MTEKATTSTARLLALMALFVLAGTPLVGYLWESINQLLSLEIGGRRLLITVPVLLALVGLLVLLARRVRQWQA